MTGSHSLVLRQISLRVFIPVVFAPLLSLSIDILHHDQETLDSDVYSCNTSAWDQGKVITFQGYQYTIYYDADKSVVLSRRNMLDHSVQNLKIPSFVLSTDDGHRNTALGISYNDGRLHLVWDHHGSPLHYTKTLEGFLFEPPEVMQLSDIESPQMVSIDSNITSWVTYPLFFNNSRGDLFLTYRVGVSGLGDHYLFNYDSTNSSWITVGKLFSRDGIFPPWNNSTARCAYLLSIQFDSNDRVHAVWTYREDGETIASNHDICYAFSDTQASVWHNNAGMKIADLAVGDPIELNDSGIIVIDVPVYSWLMNQGAMAFDSKNQPHVITYKLPYLYGIGSPVYNQMPFEIYADQKLYHYWRTEDGSWHDSVINNSTDFDGASIGDAFFDTSDSLIYYYSSSNTLQCVTFYGDLGWREWCSQPMSSLGAIYGSGLKHDRNLWSQRGVLSFAGTVNCGSWRSYEIFNFRQNSSVLHWSLDGSGAELNLIPDSTRYANSGAMINFDTSSCWTSGVSGSALCFDGLDDSVIVSNSSSLDLPNELTVLAWVQRWDDGVNSVCQRDSHVWDHYLIGDKLITWIKTSDTEAAVVSPGVVPAEEWVHVAFTVNTLDGNLCQYVNGALVNSGSGFTGHILNSGELKFGRRGSDYFKGKMDDIFVFARALSPSEIHKVYLNSYRQMAWLFDVDSKSTVIADSSFHSNLGFLNSMEMSEGLAEGVKGSAICLDGINDYLVASNSPSLSIKDELTVSAWVKREDNQVNSICQRDNHEWDIYMVGSTLVTWLKTTEREAAVVSLDAVPLNEWVHVAFTVDTQDGVLCQYVNGIMVGGGSGFTGEILGMGNLKVGKRGNDYYMGSIDGLQVFSKALSSADIMSVYSDCYCRGDWSFDDETISSVTVDASSFENNGRYINMDPVLSWTGGVNGLAMEFDGIGYVDCGNDASLNISGDLSIELWCKFSEKDSDDDYFIRKGDAYLLREDRDTQSTARKITFYLYMLQDPSPGLSTTFVPDLDIWYHIVAVYDQSVGQMLLYVNGVLESQLFRSGVVDITNSPLEIGSSFSGAIDELKIYSRVLSFDEISQHYVNGL